MGVFAYRQDTFAALSTLFQQPGGPEDEMFWSEIGKKFVLDTKYTVFNNVGLAPPSRLVQETMERESYRASSDPSYHIWRSQDRELEGIRSELAEFIGCKKTELALSINSSYGLHTTIMGVSLQPGDEILTTNHDYPRVHTAIQQRRLREGVVPVVVDLGQHSLAKKEIVSKVLASVTPKTKLVVLSQISFLIGQIMPIKELATELTKKGIPLLLDSAQATCIQEEKFEDLGAPILVTCFHKWMMGPIGTGAMVVKEDHIKSIWPLHPADESLYGQISKFEQIGTRPAAPFLALREALQLHQLIGLKLKVDRLVYLRKRLAEHFVHLPGVRLYSSLDPTICLPMLTVGFEKASTLDLASWLLTKHGIHVTVAVRSGLDGIRISPNIFTSLEDVNRLGKLLSRVPKDGIP